jgi:hypothetical protein
MLYVLAWKNKSPELISPGRLRKLDREMQVSKEIRFLQKQKAMIIASRERIFVK